MDTTLEPNTKSGMPSPLRSATSTKSASGVFGSDPGLGQPTPATAAPNDPVARTEFPLLASRNETVPVGATVPPASVTVPVSV